MDNGGKKKGQPSLHRRVAFWLVLLAPAEARTHTRIYFGFLRHEKADSFTSESFLCLSQRTLLFTILLKKAVIFHHSNIINVLLYISVCGFCISAIEKVFFWIASSRGNLQLSDSSVESRRHYWVG